MKVIYSHVPCVTLKDKMGKTYDLYMNYYDEIGDEIRIRTHYRESEVQRGWMGDLSYEAASGFDPYGKDVDNTEIVNMYADVLLARINIYEATPNQPIVWEYVFLKK